MKSELPEVDVTSDGLFSVVLRRVNFKLGKLDLSKHIRKFL
jgi:hypothetical protein